MQNLIAITSLFLTLTFSLLAKETEYDNSIFAAQEDPSALNFDKLSAVVLEKNIQSVEELLKWIKTSYPEFLSNFTLVHKSKSLQGSSYLNPRAIVFGKDARFILTFNGEASQRGFHNVEMMQTRSVLPYGAKFEFREITFNTGKKAVISEANPMKCARCHYQPFRPLWEQYDVWDGVYGKHDDAIINYEDKYASKSDGFSLMKEKREEFENYKKFLEAKDSHPRFSQLSFIEGSPVTPYNTEMRGNYKYRPNLLLTDLLTKLQVENLVAQLTSNQTSYHVLNTVASSLLHCAQTKQESLQTLLLPFEIDIFAFNLSKNPKQFNYFEGLYQLDELLGARLYEVLAKENELLPSFIKHSSYNKTILYKGNTEILEFKKEEARESEDAYSNDEDLVKYHEACRVLSETSEKKTLRQNSTIAPFAMCLSCHSDGPAPKVDFSLEALKKHNDLASAIRHRINPKTSQEEQMPPGRSLSIRERNAIEDFLDQIDH